MICRAVAGRATQLGFASRRLLCTDGTARPKSTSTVTAPHAGPPKQSDSVAEILVPDLSDLQPISESRLFSGGAASSLSSEANTQAGSVSLAPESLTVTLESSNKDKDPSLDEEDTTNVSRSGPSHESARVEGSEDGVEGNENRTRRFVIPETALEFVDLFQKTQSNSSPNQAAFLFRDLMNSGNRAIVDIHILRNVLPLLNRLGWGRTIADVLDHAGETGLVLPTSLMNTALNGIMKSGNSEQILKIIESMWDSPVQSRPDAATYNHLISAYFNTRKLDEAYEVLKEMKNRMVYPSWSTYQILISGCLRVNDSRRAFETLLAVEKQRFRMSAPLVGQVMVMCADKDDLSAVTQLMPRFQAALLPYEDDIFSLAGRRIAYRLKKGEEGQARGKPVLEISAIMSCLRAGYRGSRPDVCEKAMEWFEKMYPEMKVPSSAWYCLVGSYATSGNFTAAFDVLSRMRRAGVNPGLLDLNEALIKPLAVDLKFVDEQYYRLVDILRPEEAMERAASQTESSDGPNVEGISEQTPSGKSADDPVGGSDTSDSVDAARLSFGEELLVLRDSNAVEIVDGELLSSPVLETNEQRTIGIEEFNCIIAACSMVGDLHRAFHTYDEAQRLGFVRSTDTFNALLSGCLTDRHYSGGIRVAEEMKANGISLNGETIVLLVRLCIRCGKFDEAKDWLAKSVAEGIPVGTIPFQTLARKLMKLGRLEDVREIVTLAERHGMTSTAVLARIEGAFVKDIAALATDQVSITRNLQDDPRGSPEKYTGTQSGRGNWETESLEDVIRVEES